MASWLRSWTAHVEVLSLVPSTLGGWLTTAWNSSSRGSPCLLGHLAWHTQTHRDTEFNFFLIKNNMYRLELTEDTTQLLWLPESETRIPIYRILGYRTHIRVDVNAPCPRSTAFPHESHGLVASDVPWKPNPKFCISHFFWVPGEDPWATGP